MSKVTFKIRSNFQFYLCVEQTKILDVNLGFVIVAKEECGPEILSAEGSERQDMFKKLEESLLRQIKMCETNQAHFKVTGDVPSSNKFQQARKWNHSNFDKIMHLNLQYSLCANFETFHYCRSP